MKRALALVFVVLALGACSHAGEIKTWEQTAPDGPARLAAFVRDDHARIDVRRDAALALTRLVRRHRHVGLDVLLDALTEMPATSRDAVIAALTPELTRKTLLARPLSGDDPSLTAKDATYALLSKNLVADPKHKAELTAALLTWTQSTTLARIDDGSQRYSMQQAMRFLGATSAHVLPTILVDPAHAPRIVTLVLDIGDDATKEATRASLVTLAREVASPVWRAEKLPTIERANLDAHLTATPKQLVEQMTRYRTEQLARVYGAMKQIGGPAIVEYLVSVGADASESADARAAALSALDTQASALSAAQIDRVAAIAGDDATPDVVRDAALARLAELPNPTPRLYAFFTSKTWRPRYSAALQVLRTLAPKDIGDFMNHLPATSKIAFDVREPIAYAPRLMKLAGKPGLVAWLTSKSFGAHMTALAAYRGDVLKLSISESDGTKLPSCTADQSCSWQCSVDTKAIGGVVLSPEVPTTIGEFVRFCLMPHKGTASEAGGVDVQADKLQKDLLKSLGGTQ